MVSWQSERNDSLYAVRQKRNLPLDLVSKELQYKPENYVPRLKSDIKDRQCICSRD